MYNFLIGWLRSRCGGGGAVAAVAHGDKPIRVRDLQQGFPEGPESAAP